MLETVLGLGLWSLPGILLATFVPVIINKLTNKSSKTFTIILLCVAFPFTWFLGAIVFGMMAFIFLLVGTPVVLILYIRMSIVSYNYFRNKASPQVSFSRLVSMPIFYGLLGVVFLVALLYLSGGL